jgi:hypothetical protein
MIRKSALHIRSDRNKNPPGEVAWQAAMLSSVLPGCSHRPGRCLGLGDSAEALLFHLARPLYHHSGENTRGYF